MHYCLVWLGPVLGVNMSIETIQLWQVRQHHELYCDAVAWIENTPGVKFTRASGVTYVNGFIYYHYVKFDRREDLLAFRLKFYDLVKFK